MASRYRYRPARDGKEIEIPGVNFGNVQVKEIFRDGNFSVWHIPGSTQWSGIGMRDYVPTQFYVMQILEEPRHDTTGWITGNAEAIRQIESQDGKWREARKQAIAIAQEWAKKKQ